MDIWADFHTHTRYSHGKGRIKDNVREAHSRNLKALAITDHGPASFWIGMPLKRRFPLARRELDACQARYPVISLLLGVEANIVALDGTIDVPEGLIENLDILLVGLHPRVFPLNLKSFFYLSVFNPLSRWGLYSSREIRRANTDALIKAVERYPVDIVTHPGSNLSIDTVLLSRVCSERGTLLEINNQHACMTREYIQVAVEAGAYFALNSDAHSPEKVGRMGKANSIAASLGLGPGQVFNAGIMSEKRLNWLEQRTRKQSMGNRILPGKLM